MAPNCGVNPRRVLTNPSCVNGKTESMLPCKFEAILDLVVHLRERIARSKHVGVKMDPVVCRIGEIARLVGVIERTEQQIAGGLDMVVQSRAAFPKIKQVLV
jgi:hypothetical protein